MTNNNNKKNKIISIENLNKTFKIKIKEEGLLGSFKSIIKPKYKNIKAVNDISFSLNKGEIVGFIGPNGAGKSTTLKILSGILYPDSGNITILGKDPIKDRKEISYKIGTIFGQKPQLWFHLPAIDSFNLFSRIFDLNQKEYRKRIDYLIDRFEIKDIVNQPVRKLSLGQRMRCEFVLSLIHKPEILFLDEPTIGLDIVIKRNIRELIQKINREENISVILTSHDMGDVESVCERAIIINHGKIIYDDKLKNIKNKFLNKKIISFTSENPINFSLKDDIKIIKKEKYELKIEIKLGKISIKDVIDKIIKENEITDILIEELPIEDIIEDIFKIK
jgi:ABC-2 type transport system ATP-binding protein